MRSARRNVNLGSRTLVKGIASPAGQGPPAWRCRSALGARWKTVDRDLTAATGAYRLRYTPTAPRRRCACASSSPATPAHRSARRSVGRVNVFREAQASWYGPGLYGGHLACGGRLSPGTLGVAHKSLPCGTKVTLRHHGRSVRVARRRPRALRRRAASST